MYSIPVKDSAMVVLASQTIAGDGTTNSQPFDLTFAAVLVEGSFAPNSNGVALEIIVPVLSYSTAAPGDQTYSFQVQTSSDGVTWLGASRPGTVAGDGVPATGGFIRLTFSTRVKYVRARRDPRRNRPIGRDRRQLDQPDSAAVRDVSDAPPACERCSQATA